MLTEPFHFLDSLSISTLKNKPYLRLKYCVSGKRILTFRTDVNYALLHNKAMQRSIALRVACFVVWHCRPLCRSQAWISIGITLSSLHYDFQSITTTLWFNLSQRITIATLTLSTSYILSNLPSFLFYINTFC